MILVDERALEKMLETLQRMARGRVNCKQVQREAFECLIEVQKIHPEFSKMEVLKKALETVIEKESKPCKQK